MKINTRNFSHPWSIVMKWIKNPEKTQARVSGRLGGALFNRSEALGCHYS
jgi:hypothetical protein